jgi:hypothetical protein
LRRHPGVCLAERMEKHEKPQSRLYVSGTGFDPGAFQIQDKSDTLDCDVMFSVCLVTPIRATCPAHVSLFRFNGSKTGRWKDVRMNGTAGPP